MASAFRRKLALSTAALVAAVVVYLLLTLAPAPTTLAPGDAEIMRRTVAGAYHVHSTISDGGGDEAAIASAAARAGLKFVFVTDHGDGTRPPSPPRYIGGVLCLDGVEISTTGGHYVALDLPATPYPLGGEPRAVAEDVRRFGGFGIAAHPDSPKRQLAWTDWTVAIDGVEWLNIDSEWRRASRPRLARAFVQYFVRPGPTVTSLLNRPASAIGSWDALTADRPVVALAAHDAHGGIGHTTDEGRRAAIGSIPSYESAFRAFAIRAILDVPWSGDAAADGRALVRAVRDGRVYSVVDGVASPAFIDFRAQAGSVEARMGDVLLPGPATLSVGGVPEGGEVVFVNAAGNRPGGSAAITPDRVAGGRFEHRLEAAVGAWRVEVRRAGAPGTPAVPWLVGNPIYFLIPRPDAPLSPFVATAGLPAGAAWHTEKDDGSSATIAASDSTVRVEYALSAGERRSQFVALAVDLEGLESFDRFAFAARGGAPMRVSVQLRVPNGAGERWARSVFVDPSRRETVLPVRGMIPVDQQAGLLTDPTRVRTLLFVVDLTNAKPGDRGTLEVSDVRFGR